MDTKKAIEAILFAAGRVVTLQELLQILDIKEEGVVKQAITDIKAGLAESSLLLVDEAEGWKLTVREEFLPLVRKVNPHTELSKAIMETLAVIAWKQPILQSKIIAIRTNKAYDHIKELDNLGFILKEKQGRSYTLRLTNKFLEYFDLPNQEAAKKIFTDFKDEDIPKHSEQLGKLEVYDAGEQQELHDDREALHEKKGEHLGDLDVVDMPEEQEPVQEEIAETHEEIEQPEVNKAKLLAEQILKEDKEEESELPREEEPEEKEVVEPELPEEPVETEPTEEKEQPELSEKEEEPDSEEKETIEGRLADTEETEPKEET